MKTLSTLVISGLLAGSTLAGPGNAGPGNPTIPSSYETAGQTAPTSIALSKCQKCSDCTVTRAQVKSSRTVYQK